MPNPMLSDCPDPRYPLEWATARGYEHVIDHPEDEVPFMLSDPDHAALFHYTMFWALCAGDLSYAD